MGEKKFLESIEDSELDIAVYARSWEEGDNVTVTCDLLFAMEQAVGVFNEQKAEIERLTEEIKSIKEMTAEQVVESEKLKQSCAEAVNSFVRLETLYKIKCQELEIANKKLEEVKGGKTD